ncbi:hypothetical protein ABZV15_25020 [Streptomyces sp. NPDC005246]|uniref:hypothetical protein n=1 Tax=Streptomyces sp. NPDC005246 TaxID=3156716 RepID=UPI0033B8D228
MSTAAPAPVITAAQRMRRAVAEWGVIAHTDTDAGNSWLLVNLSGAAFPGLGTPHLVAYLYEAHEAWAFVDAPMEHWAGTCRAIRRSVRRAGLGSRTG